MPRDEARSPEPEQRSKCPSKVYRDLSCPSLLSSQLEWDMKLWWPHSEAMIAFLMGYRDSGDLALLHLFYQVAEYTFRQVNAVFVPGKPSMGLGGMKVMIGRRRGSNRLYKDTQKAFPQPLLAHSPDAALQRL